MDSEDGEDSEPPPRKKVRTPGRDEEDLEGSGGELVKNDELVWFPLVLKSQWVDASMTKRLTVSITLPCGASGKGNSELFVDDDGCSLVITVGWPAMLTDVHRLFGKWLNAKDPKERIESYHPEVLAAKEAFSKLRTRSTDKLTSTARITLPFQVQKRIESISRVGDKAGARIIIVKLKEASNNYEDAVDDDSFQIL